MTEESEGGGPATRFHVRNLQRRIKVDGRALKRFLNDVVRAVEPGASSATLVLVGDEKMRALNRFFRGQDRPTDVLAFPTGTNGDPAGPGSEGLGESYLGDIVISVETADRQASRRGSDLPSELRVLTLHGFLHLLGYDHEKDNGEMRRIEYRFRRRLGLTRTPPRRLAGQGRKK